MQRILFPWINHSCVSIRRFNSINCGPCNGPKNNRFAVFKASDGLFTIVNTPATVNAVKPPDGDAAMINPREENPLHYAILDLSGTFKFFPKPGLNKLDTKKADYTYNDILRLNEPEREPLRQARENAFGNYKARLFEYAEHKRNGALVQKLSKLETGIKTENHYTVWKEMQRYYTDGLLSIVDPDLKKLFDAVPEALDW